MKVILYYRRQCPFCKKVFAALDQDGIKIPMKELSENPKYLEELQTIGGKTQVPCLVQIDEDEKPTALYESDDIIAWLAKHKSSL